MTTPNHGMSPASTVEIPWYDLIGDPEPPEDGLQQEETILNLMSILKVRYEGDPTVLCVNQTFVIYDSNVPGSFLAPDGFIVFGVEDAKHIQRIRNSYRIDEWGPSPSFVFEVASPSTARRDLDEKRQTYARMNAQEYWRLDRDGEYYGEPLVGERLVNGEYQRFQLNTDANGDLWSRSEVLGVDFVYRMEDGMGRFLLRDSVTGEWLNTLGEERAARQEAEEQAHREAQLREEAEIRLRELEAEIERLRSQQT